MTRRTGLGRGLDALIPGGQGDRLDASTISHIPVEAISANPRQPRARFDPNELAELAQSIREHGILQPLIVTPGDAAGQFVLIAGERRLHAARQAGLTHVPALVRAASDQSRLELALIENVQRADLAPLEKAEAYRQLHDEFGLSHQAIAERVGKDRTTVVNTLGLLRLPDSVRRALADGLITEGHARPLVKLPTPQAQAAALQTILDRQLNVRQTEELVRRLMGERPPAAPRPDAPPEVAALQERLQGALGTRVRLRRNRQGAGAILIHYYSDEELNALVQRLAGDEK